MRRIRSSPLQTPTAVLRPTLRVLRAPALAAALGLLLTSCEIDPRWASTKPPTSVRLEKNSPRPSLKPAPVDEAIPLTPAVPTGGNSRNYFDPERFAGTWTEVVRLNHASERGLTRQTFTFTPVSPTEWLVIRRGWRNETGQWEEVKTRAETRSTSYPGLHLRGSLLSNLSTGMQIVVVDPSYKYTLITGADRRQFWILTRDPNPSSGMIGALLEEARIQEFPIEQALFLQIL